MCVIIPHLALCESNEREWALGPGVGEDQETSVRVFPLSASGARPDVEAMGYVTPIRHELPPYNRRQQRECRAGENYASIQGKIDIVSHF